MPLSPKQPPKTRAKSVPTKSPRKARTYGGVTGGGDSGGEDEYGDWRCSVFVSHIPIASTKEEIGGIFGRFGKVDKVSGEDIFLPLCATPFYPTYHGQGRHPGEAVQAAARVLLLCGRPDGSLGLRLHLLRPPLGRRGRRRRAAHRDGPGELSPRRAPSGS